MAAKFMDMVKNPKKFAFLTWADTNKSGANVTELNLPRADIEDFKKLLKKIETDQAKIDEADNSRLALYDDVKNKKGEHGLMSRMFEIERHSSLSPKRDDAALAKIQLQENPMVPLSYLHPVYFPKLSHMTYKRGGIKAIKQHFKQMEKEQRNEVDGWQHGKHLRDSSHSPGMPVHSDARSSMLRPFSSKLEKKYSDQYNQVTEEDIDNQIKQINQTEINSP